MLSKDAVDGFWRARFFSQVAGRSGEFRQKARPRVLQQCDLFRESEIPIKPLWVSASSKPAQITVACMSCSEIFLHW